MWIGAFRHVRECGFAAVTERMFADASAVTVDENGARSGNFRAKSTAVDGLVEKKRNDSSTACGEPLGERAPLSSAAR